MKKSYKRPFTEVIDLRIKEKITFGEGANASNDAIYAGAKQNHIIFVEEDFVEEEDTTSIWDDPWKIKYNLWEDE